MLPSSHAVPIIEADVAALLTPRQLADAFMEFIGASSQLEASYRDLQQEVAHLGVELAQRNAELTRSLAENDRMRATLQQMIDSMPCGVLVLDTAEKIVTINPEGRRLLGATSAAAETLSKLSALSGIDFEALTSASGPRDNEICLTHGDNKRWLAIGRRELRHAEGSGRALRSVWILRDVTAHKRAEQEREAARRAATLAEISTILAHEIRNPLASLELFAALIAEDRGNTAEWIANLQAGVRTLSGTVNNVLSLQGDTPPRLRPVNLEACVAGSVAFVRPIADQANVTLTFEPAGGTPSISGNEDAIRQILLNLIGNAIRHTEAGGSVTVSTGSVLQNGETKATVTVRDTGCGIPADALDRLFEAGFSVSGETPGLGLAVCRRLMTQHHGQIHVTSRAGQGSEFQLEFPAL
jgi:signal transduction histidine kinase